MALPGLGALFPLQFCLWGWLLLFSRFADNHHPKHWLEVLRLLIKGGLFWGVYAAIGMVWLLKLHPLEWLGFSAGESQLVSIAAYLANTLLWFLFGLSASGVFLLVYQFSYCRWMRYALIPLVWWGLLSVWSLLPIFIPWPLPELAVAPYEGLRWLYSGVGNGTLWTGLLLTWLAFSLDSLRHLSHRREWRFSTAVAMLGSLFLLIMAGWPATLPLLKASEPLGITVGVVQPNCSIEAVRGQNRDAKRACQQTMVELTETLLAEGKPDLIVLPEEGALLAPQEAKALQGLQGLVPVESTLLSPWPQLLATEAPETSLLFGSISYQSKPLQVTNDIFLLRGSAWQRYSKQKLVPFGESFTPEVLSLGKQFGVNLGLSLTPGEAAPVPLELSQTASKDPLKLGPLLCFELIFPELASAYKQQGADLLVNSSNLGWFHGSRIMQRQFLAHAQLRALETGLPVIVAANTGNSGVIRPNGTMMKRLLARQSGSSSVPL